MKKCIKKLCDQLLQAMLVAVFLLLFFSFDKTISEVGFAKKMRSFVLVKNKTMFPLLQNNICMNSKPRAVRCWDRKYPLVFMHIGKNGGQSFDKCISRIVWFMKGQYIGFQHFDWSGIQPDHTKNIAILLRNPVSRMISHFYFSKTSTWTRKSPIRDTVMSDYLQNYQLMLNTRMIWQDGAAAVMWLTGLHIEKYVGIQPNEVAARELESLNVTNMLLLAARRLEETWWFGFIEEQERSFELLRFQMGYNKVIKFPHIHKTASMQQVSDSDKAIIESLLPMDMWFYNYAVLMFEARWDQYKTGVFVKPELPPITEPSCISTRFAIKCNDGPLKSLYFQGKASPGHKYLI